MEINPQTEEAEGDVEAFKNFRDIVNRAYHRAMADINQIIEAINHD